jgi:hypothetical protein
LGVKCKKKSTVDILLKKEQLVVIHTLRQIEMPALKDIWDTNTTSDKMMFAPQKNYFSLYFRKKRQAYVLVY